MLEEQLKKINELSFQANKTKDEKEKEQLENDVKSIIFDLKKQAIESFKSESDIKKFLDNIIKFNNYSYNNQCLIWMQNPDANYVAPLRTFNKMGYRINSGEQGIKILVPTFYTIVKIKTDVDGKYEYKPLFALTEDELKKYKDKSDDSITYHSEKLSNFKVGSVFDASQTNMPLDEINEKLNPVLEDDRAEGIEDIFIKSIYRDGFKVKYEDKIESGAKGYCDFKNSTIVVHKGLSNLMRLKVVIHEYAHSLAHKHLLNNHQDYQEHRNKYETEAESIAYVVSKYLGMDTSQYSNMYLYSWSKDKDFKEIDDSLNTIVNYSKMIINNYEKILSKTQNISMDENSYNSYVSI